MSDRSEVLELLRIADLSMQWPHLKPLHDHAMTQLKKIAEDHMEKGQVATNPPAAEPKPTTTIVRPGGRNA